MQMFFAILRMIKIEHSIFALPFAWAGAFLPFHSAPPLRQFVFLTIAMVAMRSFAMTFNRVVDRDFDCKNPRTAKRPLCTGEISVNWAKGFCLAMVLIFVWSCWQINELSFKLAPFALFLGALYSYTKRFTWLCHFVLGAVLGLAPVAGWISVSPVISLPAVLLFWAVVFWLAGFDIFYACQDSEFDKAHGLHSAPADLGIEKALTIAAFCHFNTVLFLLLAGFAANLSCWWFIVIGIGAVILWWEHRLVSPKNLTMVNTAFFTLNAVFSPLIFLGVYLGI